MPNITDRIGRDDIVNKINSIISNMRQDAHCCIALNGDWGSGKTFVMDMLNSKCSESQDNIVIKYDAWANSFYSDPLIAILSCLIDELNRNLILFDNYETVIKDIAKEKGKAILDELSQKSGKIGAFATIIKNLISIVPKFEEANKISNAHLDSFKSYQGLISEVKSQLMLLTNDNSGYHHKLIILVDEVDRCLPDEQLKILERLHHLFDIPNCVVICAVNSKSIAQSIKTIYGIDGYEYLRKFFNFTFLLPMSSDLFLKSLLLDFEEKLKIANKTLNWNYEPIEEAYHCLLFGGNMEDVDNRELTRYEESLENICSDFGWDRLTHNYVFFVIVGLFIRKFCSTTFLTDSEIHKNRENICIDDDSREMSYYDYLLKYLNIDRKNLPDNWFNKYNSHTPEFSWYFNETVHHSVSNQSYSNSMRAFFNQPRVIVEDCRRLKELIVFYAGEQTMRDL